MPAVANMLLEPGNLRDVASGYTLGALSGLIVAATAADAPLFAMRNVAQAGTPGNLTRTVGVTALRVAMLGGVTPYAAPAGIAIAFFKATGFTANDSGGTAVQAQRRGPTGDLVPLTEIAGHIADTDANSAGTRTLAAQPFFVASFGGAASFGNSLVWTPEDGIPRQLTGDEGIVGQLVAATPATGTMRLFVGVEFVRFGG